MAESQETPYSPMAGSAGLGVAWILQLLPFQRSARAIGLPETLSIPTPVAVQLVTETQETLAK